MKIAIYGASVSAQSVRHDNGLPVGYSEFLRREHMDGLGAEAIVQFAYAGNRLADGGMIRLSEVIEYRPDICIVEPIIEDRSRGLTAEYQEMMFVYDSLIKNNIVPVTLFLPWPYANKDLPIYRTAKDICNKWNLPIIEFQIPDNFNTEDNFIGVHTLPVSGKLYADRISSAISSMGPINSVLETIKKYWNNPENVLSITKCEVPIIDHFKDIIISVDAGAVRDFNFRLLQRQEIGMFSPVFSVKIIDENGDPIADEKIMSAWDPYCHYTRLSYVLLATGVAPRSPFRLVIKKMDEAPRYASCRRNDVEWPPISELEFRPKGPLYLIGSSKSTIRLISYE